MSAADAHPADPAPGEHGLEVEALEKSFGRTTVLRGVDLAVRAGGLLAVLGPSGCGKTTLLRSIAGFTSVDGGTIRVHGRTVVGPGTWVPPERRRVGIVPQEGALFPHLRVGQNVAFGIPKGPDRAARVQHWLELVGLAHAVDARPHELSGGQQQRVALARALAADPSLVLLDEPFASLDAALRVAVRAEIAGVLRQTGRTAVLVTHDQQEALSTADLVGVMLHGRLAQLAPPAEVYGRPASLAVACFVGEAVLVDGEVRDGAVVGPLGRHAPAMPTPEGPATLVLRPEQLHVGVAGVPVQVQRASFTGPDTSLRLVTEGGVELTSRAPGVTSVLPGDRVHVVVDGPVLAYPKGAETDPAA